MGEALGALGVATWPAPGGQPVLSVWPGLHAGVSLDAERYGWTEGDLVVTWPADDATGAAHMVAQRLDIVTGAQRWRP